MTTWYKAGTVSVTNGSATVGGAGTAWVASVQIGDAIHLPDGRAYEITAVASNTSLTVSPAYMGSTASAQAYRIQPTRGLVQRLIDTINTWLANQQAYLEGALAGRFGNGTAALPGISFANDIDTGISRTAENQMSFSTNGIRRVLLTNTALQLDALLTGSAIVSGTTDGTANKVLTTGYGGLGTAIALTSGDNLDNITFGGLYSNTAAGNTAGNNYPISSAGALVVIKGASTNASQIYITYADSAAIYFRTRGPGGWTAWRRLDAERGSNANGDYVRYPDGTQICWQTAVLSQSVAAGSYAEATWTYPATFLSGSVPQPVPTMRSLNDAAGRQNAARYLRGVSGGNGATSGFIGVYNSHTSAVDARVDGMVIGRWF